MGYLHIHQINSSGKPCLPPHWPFWHSSPSSESAPAEGTHPPPLRQRRRRPTPAADPPLPRRLFTLHTERPGNRLHLEPPGPGHRRGPGGAGPSPGPHRLGDHDLGAEWNNWDLALGIVIEGEARAYPHNILWWHEIINDRIADHPICITLSPLTGTGMVFDGSDIRVQEAQGRIELGVSGLLFNTNLTMYDRRDNRTLYSQMTHQALNNQGHFR